MTITARGMELTVKQRPIGLITQHTVFHTWAICISYLTSATEPVRFLRCCLAGEAGLRGP